MPDLDAVESRRDEGLEPLTPSAIAWVRPDRQRPRLVGNDDRIFDRKPVLRHEGAAVAAEVAHEGITKIVHDPARDQGAGDMGPSNRSPIRLNEHFVQGDRDPEHIEPVDDFLGASVAECAQLEQSLLQGLQV